MTTKPSRRALDEARARVRDCGGPELLERLEHLDGNRSLHRDAQPSQKPAPPEPGDRFDADVVMAGGGLSLLIAPLMARRGASVVVVERGRAGVGHREWNASRAELRALSAAGLFAPREIDAMIVNRYRHGTCAWHGGGVYPVRGVLDCAVDAGALLGRARELALQAGVRIVEQHEVCAHATSPTGVRVRLRDSGARRGDAASLDAPSSTSLYARELTARVLVDARGASSPFTARADLSCPTVGGVLGGLERGDGPRQIDHEVGEILATTEHVEEGRQHIWEAFPGRPDQTTVYLFYYAPSPRVGPGALISLYARFFATLPRYKGGDARLLRPTFGYIPGWSRLGPPPAPREPRVALVGDAASRHSPLTFCGFGSMLRSIDRAAAGIVEAVERDDRSGRPLPSVVDDAPVHRGTGALARMMADPPAGPALNRLLDAAFATLHEMGDEAYGALLRDEMDGHDFAAFLHRTSLRRPRVYADVFRILGPRAVSRWGAGVARNVLSTWLGGGKRSSAPRQPPGAAVERV